MNSIFIIAEAGVNHNGSRDLAFQLVDVAVESGADAVKFQTFKAENLVTKDAGKASYQQQFTTADEPQLVMLKRLELDQRIHYELMQYCSEKGIKFLSTAFDSESLYFLVNDLGLNTLKISSGEITNGPFLLEHARTGCDLVLSTGMASIGEVEQALAVLAFGLINPNCTDTAPSLDAFQQAFSSEVGKKVLNDKVTLLHCTSEYPAPYEEINLNAMLTLHETFGLNVGYSDHSEGITVPIAAAAIGATLIEKHFTLDKTLPGPDHMASLEPEDLKRMIDSVRIVEKVMGAGVKEIMPSELKNRPIVRKSLVASKDISAGELFTEENITVMRPGTGMSPMRYWEFLRKESSSDIKKGEVIF